MENVSELVVYKASAGSGKTFTLAVEYIRLLVQNPKAYRNILAVTFTNKATAEMKERILSQLYGIAVSDSASEVYLKKVMEATGFPAQEVRERARKALSFLIHDYNFFRVETIDSFFQSVMRNLSRELGLGANLEISLNNSEVMEKAVDHLLEKLDRSSLVLTWLLDFIKERVADDKRWQISNELKHFGMNIFDEVYMERGNTLREKLRDPSYVAQYKKELQELLNQLKDAFQGFADHFYEVMEANDLQPEELAYGKNAGATSYFRNIRKGDYSDKICSKRVEQCMAGSCWATKSSPRRAEIEALAQSELIDLLCNCEEFRQKNLPIYNTCKLSVKYLNQLRLLGYIDEEVRDSNHQENRFLLSDTNNLLHQLMQEGDSSFVFEKMGTTINYVMIDEFQDTSRLQWDNFKMLLMEGLSQANGGSLIVGDVKQSIYRWRNGDWGILNGLKEKFGPYPITEKQLNVNRRSETNIIRFNNEFFTQARELLCQQYQTELEQPCEMIASAYREVEQDSPKEQERGYVHIEFLEKEEELSYPEVCLQALGEQVDQLVHTGVKLSDIAILIRKNRNIPLIADYFSANYPDYRIVSDEAFRLDASAAIETMMNALRLLLDEHDEIASAQLARCYQQEVLHHEMDWNTLLLNGTQQYLPKEFIECREELCLMPLYELLERIFKIFHLQEIEQQDSYLFSFFDAVLEYLGDHSSDLTLFLQYWEEELCSKTIPAGELEGIRIYSIHKSKGLEFHTVLVPFCDWSMERENGVTQLLWCHSDLEPFNALDLQPIAYSKEMAQSAFSAEYLSERTQLWVDNLNLLYVAFTRASKNLIVWGAKKDRNNGVSTLIADVLSMMGGDVESGYTHGEICLSEEQKKHDVTNRLLLPADKQEVKMESFSQQIEFRQSNQSVDFIRGDEEPDRQEQYIRQGKLLHRIFSTIRTLEDVDAVLKRMQMDGVVDSRHTASSLKNLVSKAVSTPQVASWFSGEWELFNERSMLQQIDGELVVRRPDRVMIQLEGGEVVVVDFKFGKRRQEYRQQVYEYMQWLRQMGHPQVKGYLWYVYKNELEEVTL
jgi:ATP-dependent exoDNAse (exonuclease V) beta subunit